MRHGIHGFQIALALCGALALSGCSKEEEAQPSPGAAPASDTAPAPAPPAPPPSKEANSPESVPELANGEPLGLFEGTLPCADCAGIRTVLTLYLEPDRYVLEETYLGTRDGDRSVRSEGRWSMLQGVGDAPDATVIRIDPGKPEGVKSFLEMGGDALELLDREGHPIASDVPHRLVRRESGGS